VSEPKKRPGALWLLFYGRRRRGFPWLLVWVGVAVVLAGLSFGLVAGPDISRAVFPISFGVLILGAVAFAVAAWLWPRRRR
jgi:purine-cytosine permease-like protein